MQRHGLKLFSKVSTRGRRSLWLECERPIVIARFVTTSGTPSEPLPIYHETRRNIGYTSGEEYRNFRLGPLGDLLRR